MLPSEHIQFKKKTKWRIWVSIPVPPACKAGALPFELIPPAQKTIVNNYGIETIETFLEKLGSRKSSARSPNLGSVCDGSRTLVFG